MGKWGRGVSVGFLGAFFAACGMTGATAQGFSNLDFESIGASSISPDGIWLTWNLAAPGWRHPLGGDTAFVYHKNPPNNFGQYYFLADSASTTWAPLQGEYSLALVSGHYNRNDNSSPWVKAFLEQDGSLPPDASTLQLFARGEFSLSINSTPINMTALGGDLWAGDVSAFAGQDVTLRIMNEATRLNSPLIIDNVGFLPPPVPEPSSLALLGLGGAALLARRRKL